jgi:hypothetical protein
MSSEMGSSGLGSVSTRLSTCAVGVVLWVIPDRLTQSAPYEASFDERDHFVFQESSTNALGAPKSTRFTGRKRPDQDSNLGPTP